MSEVSHFFAAWAKTSSSLRTSLERARLQAIVASPGDGATTSQAVPSSVPDGHWVGFASPSENRQALRGLTERLVEVFEESGDWSVNFFVGGETLSLHAGDLEPAREGFGIIASQRDWLRRFFGRAPDALLATLAVGGVVDFCKASGIPFLEWVDQGVVPWERLAREFPGRAVLNSTELYD